MNTLEVQLGKSSRTFVFPSGWNELSPRQLSKLIPLLPVLTSALARVKQEGLADIALKSFDSNLQALRIKALWVLLDLPWWNYPSQKAILSLYPDEMLSVLSAIDFLVLSPKRTTMPFTKVRAKGVTLVGPGDQLTAFTAEEYHFAHLKLTDLAKENEKENPDKDLLKTLTQQLCYVLYRPKGEERLHNSASADYKGDQRVAFNRFAWESQSRVFETVPVWKQKVIVWWFGQMNRLVQESHPRIFSGNEGESSSQGWLPIFRMLAKDPMRTQEVGSLKLSALLWELNEQIKEADRAKLKSLK